MIEKMRGPNASSARKAIKSTPEIDAAQSGPRILVVEDEIQHALFLQQILDEAPDAITGKSYAVNLAPNIEAARLHLARDCIDIYLVDLKMVVHPTSSNIESGEKFVDEVSRRSNAGIIVCSSIHPDREAQKLLELGADDYVWKTPSFWQFPPVFEDTFPSILRARITALWRRIQFVRPKTLQLYAHANRVFDVGGWKFVIGSRTLTNTGGNSVRLSNTEHALLRYACVIEDHSVHPDRFAEDALRRDRNAGFRLDNLVHRLKSKLGDTVEWRPLGDKAYKLLTVRELGSSAK